MKVSLISPYPDITCFGIRTLSAHLRAHGFRTQLIFLPDPFGDHICQGVPRYQETVLDQATSLCEDSDLIGVTLMTNFFEGAVQITERLKRGLRAPIVWGGIHPTIRPEESLRFADIACIGEGEETLLELCARIARGEDYSDLRNLWVKKGRGIIRNDLSPLPANLDRFDFPDYSMLDHHAMVGDRILPLDHEITKEFLRRGTVADHLGRTGYQTMTSRGCPYGCAYCINDTINKMYGSKGKLRWRSVSHVIEELAWVRENMPYVDYIWISDDEFMARKMDELREFCRQYKSRVGLPFSCLVSPLSVIEEKMKLLVDAGLIYVQMGVESGSVRMQELFGRKQMSNSRMSKAIRIINSFQDQMHPPSYDFLVDVPWETTQDKVDSLSFISEIPKPFRIQPFTLILYPGTRLYELAKGSGMITDEIRDIYNKTYVMREANYLNLLLVLSREGKFPARLLKLLISPPLLSVLNSKPMQPFFSLLYRGIKAVHKMMKR